MKKINAYTLLEVTVAMLLSAITITICYTAYGLTVSYFKVLQEKNEKAAVVLSFRHALARDFQTSDYVLKNEMGIALINDSTTISYTFQENMVLRRLSELHTDTFKVKLSGMKTYFEGTELVAPDTVDRLDFNLTLAKDAVVPIQINKYYSATDLFH